MMKKNKNKKTILAVFPNTIGLCFAVFEGDKLVDYGINYIRPVDNKKTIEKMKHHLNFYNPTVVLIRELSKSQQLVNNRNKKLIDSICELINNKQGIELYQYSRNRIQEVFHLFEVHSKYQISQKILYWFPQLAGYEYPYRKDFMNENHNTGLFSAVSLAVIYLFDNEYYYGNFC